LNQRRSGGFGEVLGNDTEHLEGRAASTARVRPASWFRLKMYMNRLEDKRLPFPLPFWGSEGMGFSPVGGALGTDGLSLV